MKHIIVTGHFGSGKTNIAVNLALNEAKISSEKNFSKRIFSKRVFLVDADVVNPYFRSADNADILNENGVSLIAPVYANTNLDIPAMPPDVNKVFGADCTVFWDIGGDETGAVVLGRYSDEIAAQGYEMLYVVNFYRPLTEEENSLAELLHEIERTSRLKITALVNNSNLGGETSAETVANTEKRMTSLSESLGLPVKYTFADEKLTKDLPRTYPLKIVTKRLW